VLEGRSALKGSATPSTDVVGLVSESTERLAAYCKDRGCYACELTLKTRSATV